ncbi:MAG: gluconokinase [Acidobacteriota bacterium]
MQEPLILALDIGTSSIRAALYDADGNVVPSTMVKNERKLDSTEDGGAEIDADKAFRQVVAAIDVVVEKAKGIDGVITHAAASSFWHSLMGVDADGKPTTKVFGWADTRSRKYVAKLRTMFDEGDVHNRTGARFHPSFWPAKLMWLRKEHPEVFKRTAKWISFSDYVAMKLSTNAQPVTSVSMASATGIFDIRKCDWDEELLKRLGIGRTKLPEIAASNTAGFGLNSRFKRRWQKLAQTQFYPAIGDGAANNIGAGCVKKTRAALMVGTSGAMRVAYKGEPPATIPPGLWCYRIDRERVIIGGALSDGGGLYQWLKDNLQLDTAVETEIANRSPDGHGLTFLPFLAGERSTGYHEYATGGILGLKSSTDATDIVHAALESVAYRFAVIFGQLSSVAKIREITASGGALRESPVWTQILADVLGRELSLPDTHEASSRGAVLLALESIGRIDNIENEKPPSGTSFVPDRSKQTVYRTARRRHQQFYDLILKANQ